MERLTKKEKGIYDIKERTTQKNEFHIMPSTMIEICQKLGQLEDLEEELGIDLITLFKAMKNGIYWKGTNVFGITDIYYENKQKIRKCESGLCFGNITFMKNIDYVNFKDYGKTWALTREELEEK